MVSAGKPAEACYRSRCWWPRWPPAPRRGVSPNLPAVSRESPLEVSNQSRNAVTIYVWSDTYQNRLGMVEALNRDTFNFRWNLAGRVYFLMDFLAQGCVLSEPIDVIDGDELILTVQPIDHRRASRAACRRP